MKYIFNKFFIKENELLFYIYLIIILIMILATVIFVIKEVKKK